MARELREDLWGKLAEARERERAELRALGLKDSKIDEIFWERARNGTHLNLGETALHSIEVPEDPSWPTTPDLLSSDEPTE